MAAPARNGAIDDDTVLTAAHPARPSYMWKGDCHGVSSLGGSPSHAAADQSDLKGQRVSSLGGSTSCATADWSDMYI